MVLNPDENREPVSIPDNPIGYLVCSHCRGYYELQEGEKPDDFESCECGSPLEYYQSQGQFRSRIHNPDSVKSDTSMEYDDYNEAEDQKLDDQMNTGNVQIPENKQIINRFSPQEPVSEEVLTNIKEEGRDLWDFLDEYKTKKRSENGNTMPDVMEINRLMMLVDQKRTIEENNNDSRMQSLSHRIGPIGFLGAAIVLLITALVLTLAGEMV